MDELEALRQRRLQELQAQQAEAQAEAEAQADAQAAQESALEQILVKILDSEARERLTRIRLSRPDFADTVTKQLVQLAQSGRLQKRLSDTDLRQILAQLTPKDRDINITRK